MKRSIQDIAKIDEFDKLRHLSWKRGFGGDFANGINFRRNQYGYKPLTDKQTALLNKLTAEFPNPCSHSECDVCKPQV